MAEESIVKFLTGTTATGRQNYDTKQAAGELNGAIFFDLYNRQIVVEGKALNNNISVVVSTDPETGAEVTTYEFETTEGRKVTIQKAGKNAEVLASDTDFSAIKDFKGGLLTAEQMAMLNQCMNDLGYTIVDKEVNGEAYKGFQKSATLVAAGNKEIYWQSLD